MHGEINTLENLYDQFVSDYCEGRFVEGYCGWDGGEGLMSPGTLKKEFTTDALGKGFDAEEVSGMADELADWCECHLDHLRSKFN